MCVPTAKSTFRLPCPPVWPSFASDHSRHEIQGTSSISTAVTSHISIHTVIAWGGERLGGRRPHTVQLELFSLFSSLLFPSFPLLPCPNSPFSSSHPDRSLTWLVAWSVAAVQPVPVESDSARSSFSPTLPSGHPSLSWPASCIRAPGPQGGFYSPWVAPTPPVAFWVLCHFPRPMLGLIPL